MALNNKDNAKSVHARQMGFDSVTNSWIPININSAGGLDVNVINIGMLTEPFDKFSQTMSGTNISTIVYTSSACAVMTLTFVYSGTQIVSVARS